MEQLFADYLSYYEARYKRFEGNSLYPNTYAAEKAMYDLLASCSTLEEFGPKLKETKLNDKVAFALVKDKETALAKLYDELNEPVRAWSSHEVLKGIDQQTDLMEMMNWFGEIETRGMRKISIDGFIVEFANGITFKVLEDIEVSTYTRDEGPAEFKQDQQDSIDRDLELGREGYKLTVKNNVEWEPGWQLDHALVWEERHRRELSCPDEELKLKIDQHKPYIGQ